MLNTDMRMTSAAGFSLEPLPYPVFFVCPDPEKWMDLIDSNELPKEVTPLFARCSEVGDIWAAQTYILLKQRGLDVRLVKNPVPRQICIFPYDRLSLKELAFNSYVVACRHDRARPAICEQRIVHNKLNVNDHTDHFVPHWPQPNLQPRDRTRGFRVENLTFKGIERNLAYPFKTPAFTQQLRALDINFVMSPANQALQFQDWTDYRQADVVLAVRNNTQYDLSIKPALKLVNAWFAGCPAILGPEPAYQALRQSELDYIEVRTVKDVIEALHRLKTNPALYEAMVENGQQRAQEFTPDRIAQVWRAHLAGPIAVDYERWQKQSLPSKLMGRPVKFIARSLRHWKDNQYHWERVLNGPRLFGNEPTA